LTKRKKPTSLVKRDTQASQTFKLKQYSYKLQSGKMAEIVVPVRNEPSRF
jgi:hypothetical protein